MKRIDFDLGLPDDSFWNDPWENEGEVSEKLGFDTEHMTRIGAPKEVDLNRRSSFPLVIYQQGTPKDLYYYDIELSALIVTVDVERNGMYYDVVSEMEENEEPKEENHDQSYTMTNREVVDLKSHLDLDLRPGKYLNIIINREDVSNRVATMVKAADDFYKGEEVEKLIEEQRTTLEPPPVWPPLAEYPEKSSPHGPRSLPVYAEYEDVPEVPEEIGISVVATRVQLAKEDAVCLVRGSFRLPSDYGVLVPPHERPDDETARREYLRMPIHLIVTGSKDPNPFAARLMVPVYDEVEKEDEGKPVVGYFTFDILKYADLIDEPQTCFMYFFSGEVMTDPVPIAFVDTKEVEL